MTNFVIQQEIDFLVTDNTQLSLHVLLSHTRTSVLYHYLDQNKLLFCSGNFH